MQNLRSNGGDRKASKRPFMKLFTSDYRDGTAQLSFELQGFYFRILTYLHDGDAVPSDPAKLAIFLQCSPRTVRAYLPKLIAAGKLYEADGVLRNKRVDRDLEPNSDRVEPDFKPSSNRVGAEVEPKSSRTPEKPESNQEPENHTMEITTSTSTAIAISREDSHTASSLEQEPDGLAGLNGMAPSMISDVVKWMVGGDEQCARTWLANTTRTYGSAITKAAYHKLGTDMLNGETFAKPLTAWCAIALRMQREEASKAVTQTIPQPSAYQAARAQIIAGALQ